MTYAGLKSMIYAGLSPDDPRVKAAVDYIKAHYSLDENPGMGEPGLYYYYQTFAKALAMLGQPTLVDASGKSHDWQRRAGRRPGQAPAPRRRLGQQGRSVHGRGSEPGHLLWAAGAGVCEAEGVIS